MEILHVINTKEWKLDTIGNIQMPKNVYKQHLNEQTI